MDLLLGPTGPLIVFVARLIDVPLATIRTILMSRGQRAPVVFIAFFESLAWLIVVSAVIAVVDSSRWMMVAYAGGFAAGNFVGMTIERRLGLGVVSVFVLTRVGVEVAGALREAGYGVTEFVGQGRDGRVEMVMSVMGRRRAVDAERLIHSWDPGALVVATPTAGVRNGVVLKRK